MKRLVKLFSLGLFVMTVSLSSAQDQTNTKGDKAFEWTNKIDRRVTLTEEQRPIVHKLMTDYFNEIKRIKDDTKSFETKKNELDLNYANKLKTVLTAEQFGKFEAYAKELKEEEEAKKENKK